ncbi:MAG TPA: HAD family phosphatase [Vicinamibacterales bacterium]|nr:HAD family phosphatase [Vicinamibacterales bacterium]
MPLRAIVFDFDGVIANSEPLHFRAYASVLAPEGVALTERDYYARYLGFDDVGAFEAIARDRRLPWSPGFVRTLVERKAIELEKLERHVSVLFPGAADAIRCAAASVPIAIASGARGDEIRRVVRREQLEACFSVIVSAEDTPVSKPAPEPYLHAVAQLRTTAGASSLAAADCVAIEDSRWGLESARAAGLKTIAVTNTYDAAALVRYADLVISSLADFDLDVIAGLCRDR